MLSGRLLSYLKKKKIAKMVTRCHSLSFVVTRCHSLYHSLSLIVLLAVICGHSLSLVVPLVVTHCTTLCHLWPLVVICCHSLYHSLSLVVTWCTTRLSFYKRSLFFKFHFTNLRYHSWNIMKQGVLIIWNNRGELQFEKNCKVCTVFSNVAVNQTF